MISMGTRADMTGYGKDRSEDLVGSTYWMNQLVHNICLCNVEVFVHRVLRNHVCRGLFETFSVS